MTAIVMLSDALNPRLFSLFADTLETWQTGWIMRLKIRSVACATHQYILSAAGSTSDIHRFFEHARIEMRAWVAQARDLVELVPGTKGGCVDAMPYDLMIIETAIPKPYEINRFLAISPEGITRETDPNPGQVVGLGYACPVHRIQDAVNRAANPRATLMRCLATLPQTNTWYTVLERHEDALAAKLVDISVVLREHLDAEIESFNSIIAHGDIS